MTVQFNDQHFILESLLSRQEEQLQEMARMEHELEIATQQVELEKMRSKLEKLEAMSHRSSVNTKYVYICL